eukprot:1159422-Pelagomonas_calceolata.AAC.5
MVTFWEGAYKAGGSFEADCIFLIVEGACTVLKNYAIHRIEIQACLTVCTLKPVFSMHLGFQSILKVCRHGTLQRFSTATHARQPHQLSANQWHLEVAQRHHAGLCKSISGKAVTLHTVLLSVVGLVVIMNILCIAEEPRLLADHLWHRFAIALVCFPDHSCSRPALALTTNNLKLVSLHANSMHIL